MKPAYLVFCALLTISTAASATVSGTTADEAADPEAAEAEPVETIRSEIVVTSTLPDLATSHGIPGRELSDSGTQDVCRFLRGVAGIDAISRGTINLEPTIRGLQEAQVALFVDGTRTFAAGPARMDSGLSHVGPHAVQSLEIVKGPFALSWGSGALSAIRLVTFRPDFAESPDESEWRGNLGAGWGENADSSDAYAGIWGRGEKVRYYLSAGRRTGGDYTTGDGTIIPGSYSSNDYRWRLGFRPSDRLSIDYSGGLQNQDDLDFAGRLLDATYFNTHSHTLDLAWHGAGPIRDLAAQVFVNRKDHRMNNDSKPTALDMPGRIPPFALRVDLPTESDTVGGSLRIGLTPRGDTEWSLGLDTYRLEQTATRTISRRSNDVVLFTDIVWPDAELTNLGGWTQLVHRRGKASFGATVRLDQVKADAGEVSPYFLSHTTGDLSRDESNLSAAVNAVVNVSSDWSLEIGLGRAVRTASALERYSDRFPATKFQLSAEFMGNPLLQPEESLELDFGARGRHGDLYLQFSGFYRRIDHYITVAPDSTLSRRLPLSPPVVYRYVNGDEAIYYGGEALLQHRVNQKLSWNASVSYVWAKDQELDEPVLGIAPLHGSVGLRWTPVDSLWIGAAVRWYDAQNRVATSRFEQPTAGYGLVDLSAGYRFHERVSVTAGIDNLTGEAYASHLNAPNPYTGRRILEPGRSLRLGIELDF